MGKEGRGEQATATATPPPPSHYHQPTKSPPAQLCQPPWSHLPKARRELSTIAPHPTLWVGGLGTQMVGIGPPLRPRRPGLSPSPANGLLYNLGQVHPVLASLYPICAVSLLDNDLFSSCVLGLRGSKEAQCGRSPSSKG